MVSLDDKAREPEGVRTEVLGGKSSPGPPPNHSTTSHKPLQSLAQLGTRQERPLLNKVSLGPERPSGAPPSLDLQGLGDNQKQALRNVALPLTASVSSSVIGLMAAIFQDC